MSPEQAKGKPVDRRADIWAFGVVLYEMLTGERLFKGEDMSETLASVLKDTPSYASLPAQVPPRLRRLLERCLDRDVKERLRDIGEARVEIAKIQSGAADTAVVPAPAIAAPSPAKVNRSIVFAAVAAAILAAVAVAWWFGRERSARESAWSEFTQLTDASGVETGPSISPDGQSFAYASKAKGSWDIYVQRVGGRNPVVVAGDATRDEVWPSFSPDGKQIAYSLSGGRGGIFVVGATGESARRLTDFGSNPAWSPDGQHIVFCTEEVISPYATYSNSTLWTVDLNGSGPTKIQDEVSAYQPAWSPSGRRIAFWQNVQGQRDLATIPASGGPRVMVTSDVAVDWAPVWSPDGHFLYFASDRGGSMGIWRIAIDEASGRPQGAPEVIAAGADGSMDLPHLSADGSSLIFRSMIESTNPAAIAFDPKTERAGEVRLLQHRTGNLIPMDVSPDGQWIALNNLFERQQDIFIMRPDGTGLTRLTDDMARDWFPRFTPDSTAVTFISNKSGAYDGWFIRLDGSNRIRLTDLPNDEVNIAMLAPDGRRLLAMGEKGTKIGSPPWPITPKTSIELRDLSVGGGSLGLTYWSRGGRWLSGMILQPSGETRGNALYDVATDKVRQLSDDAGGYELAWLPGSTRVVYFTNSDKLVIQDVESLKRREIEVKLPFPPEAGREITASPDGRTLYYGARQVEANIWKVERSAARVKQ